MFVVTLIRSLKPLAVISLLFAPRNCDSSSFHGNFLWLYLLISDSFILSIAFQKTQSPPKEDSSIIISPSRKHLTGEPSEIPVMGVVLYTLDNS